MASIFKKKEVPKMVDDPKKEIQNRLNEMTPEQMEKLLKTIDDYQK